MVTIQGEQPLSMVHREVQGILTPRWLARSVDRNVLGSRIRGLTASLRGEGWASALIQLFFNHTLAAQQSPKPIYSH